MFYAQEILTYYPFLEQVVEKPRSKTAVPVVTPGGPEQPLEPSETLDIDDKMADLDAKLIALDESFNIQMNNMQNQLLSMEKELGGLLERINLNQGSPATGGGGGGAGTGGGGLGEGNMGLGEMFETVQRLQIELVTLNNATEKMTEEQEKKQQDLDVS